MRSQQGTPHIKSRLASPAPPGSGNEIRIAAAKVIA
jgi:hypothetical protein